MTKATLLEELRDLPNNAPINVQVSPEESGWRKVFTVSLETDPAGVVHAVVIACAIPQTLPSHEN